MIVCDNAHLFFFRKITNILFAFVFSLLVVMGNDCACENINKKEQTNRNRTYDDTFQYREDI